jgi:hypothetical protein
MSGRKQMRKLDVSGLPVEVSGWDSEGQFFVEHCTLETTETGHNTIVMRCGVLSHTLLFIRALDGDIFANRYPEAYYVQAMESSECLGAKKLSIVDFPPRRKNGGEPKGPNEHPISVRDEVNR